MTTGKKLSVTNRRAGSILAEAACGLILISTLIIGGVLFLLDAGLSVYYKTKLAFAAEAGARNYIEGAQFLGAPRVNATADQLSTSATNVVDGTLSQMGMPPASSVVAQTTSVGGLNYATVTVNVSGLKLITGGCLPSAISLTETACVPFSNTTPTAVLGLQVQDSANGRGFYIPCYESAQPDNANKNSSGKTAFIFPAGNFPYYQVNVQSANNNNAVGPYQNMEPNGPFKSY